ncbi:hypothetical protein QJS04_geneDACA006050 [Acorus gramineus]|uniref:Uncharacterized protein n=1 Tax=Acorus gramineus TaxID=55184 RepID=A0AAV9B5J5_ACOGR|nr:hypothetical protein QJS04_geneDACA006050 [Acorus gramineus]
MRYVNPLKIFVYKLWVCVMSFISFSCGEISVKKKKYSMNAMEVDVDHERLSSNSGPMSGGNRCLGMGGIGNVGGRFNLKKLQGSGVQIFRSSTRGD